ncbi:SpoIID/LytB domain-containing protein [Euhalothece natronophila Z-M001]|uniref:SpoIID/LytB domain-containing protein n=1 Tax=Euhalothece natronophila Z-M001 TaxID=522448 RepID=A0A5B8NKU6_9CHRO|nr:SpoIID/LytB domain-containing protein [Euhalothece natronophila]QDZ39588.1 SpoIID/LytB domain-containing protein [Euhalothece natronophila Z-M001]
MILSAPKKEFRVFLQSLLSSVFLWLLLSASAQATTALRVLLQENAKQVPVGSSTTAVVKDAQGNALGEIEGMSAFRAVGSGQGVKLGDWQANQLSITPRDDGYVWIGNRWYRGKVRLVNRDSNLTVINKVNLEDYLYSVVGAEMPPSWPLEALKAQAVAARSYALHQQENTGNGLYDVQSTTASQVYKGVNSETERTHQAVNSTEGEVLQHNGNVILAVFHSSSGGHTENVEDVWSSPLPYLRGVADYDQTAPVYQWQQAFSPTAMGRRLRVGTVQEIIPQQASPQGRIRRLKVVGDRDTRTLSGDQFRHALNLRSTLFQVQKKSDRFVITGRGFGHGIGLSQWGAHYLAQEGANYRQILGHYYRQVKLARLETDLARN